MRRHLLIVAVFLLAGAVVNVAVAWGIAGASTNYDAGEHHVVESRPVLVLTGFGRAFVTRSPFSAGQLERIRIDRERLDRSVEVPARRGQWSLWWKSDPPPNLRMEEACGWPLLSLRWYLLWPRQHELYGAIELGGVRRYRFRNGNGSWFPITFPNQEASVGDRTLPHIPIWPGFAVNTIFYAVILWLLIPGPFMLRRFIRRRRGLCPACAYPRGESGVCSECGKALV